MITNNFVLRHNGPRPEEAEQMLKTLGVTSLDQLIDETVPGSIRLPKPLNLPKGINEYEYLDHIKKLASKNKVFKSYIGLGYYNTVTPSVILRNIFENPGWYTSYTPYQAEISQGRLEALLIYQTMVSDLTGMPIANASLLDEGTAAAEAMIMFFNARPREAVKNNANLFLVSDTLFPQTIDVIRTRSKALGIEIKIQPADSFEFTDKTFGAIVQYPDRNGDIRDYSPLAKKAKENHIPLAVAADLLSLTLLTPPGEWGADVVLGSTQRFGIPMGFGGPHAAFFATREEFKRFIPGRIIGISVDAAGNKAFRMALQTREQHIKREKATSNICTAQALLAIMAGMYAVYHGPKGIREIARHLNILTGVLAQEAKSYGYTQLNKNFFDTVSFRIPETTTIKEIRKLAIDSQVNLLYIDDRTIGVSLDETTSLTDVNLVLHILASANRVVFREFVCDPDVCGLIRTFDEKFDRKSEYLHAPEFNSYHSETEMMRYLKKLENRDLSLNRSMIPLGSCTMKLNAATEMIPLSWPEFGSIHPFAPADQTEGYKIMIDELEKALCEITGFKAVTFQPNSGASGEYTGLLVIKAWHESRGEGHRKVCLIPASAHGTNPASAAMAGMEVVVVKTDESGNIDIPDLREKAEKNKDRLAALMVTYPSTHGVFEEGILEIVKIIHENGGQVYMDGANMNAQVGLTNPGTIGADLCHLNLHKTFAIPHGGGGPGVGPICVAAHLKPFLPGHTFVPGSSQATHAVASAPYGSAFILPISYAYIKMAGGNGLTEATKYAILNANYLKTKLEGSYKILYTGSKGRVAHEMILDCNQFSKTADVQAIDIAKRLMDYGFHAPTVAFPVHGTLMVEPTESEPISELDRLVNAMIAIREEIAEIEEGKADKDINPIKKAPHTVAMVTADEWTLPYTREKAAFPMPCDKQDKYWPAVTRIDDAYGDRNLVCTCSPVSLNQ
ncbi:MAG TPA: aminomethyl-transferring glycine dehydrogenase [Bacteroidales bacterium]|nr:aminomethyl-transferring glycine dehydrogenase [Bacteroidales bacterium]HPT02431.1 aminomethyl-transferring glycine dehydrogenase [Bacteroidales bacterium]